MTPAADGKYYHVVQSGETLSWIAGLYGVNVTELMSWNGLNDASIIQPEQKLVLQVTPPATPTFTPGPPTSTPAATQVRPSATASLAPSPTADPPTPTAAGLGSSAPVVRFAAIGAALILLAVVGVMVLRNR